MKVPILGRWISRAHHRVEVSIDVFAPASDVVRDLWIQWHIPPDGDVDILDVEAMELLELFAHSDYEIAWIIILQLVGQDVLVDLFTGDALSQPECRVYPRFVVHNVQFLHAAGTFQKFADWLVLPIDSAEHSPTYQSVRTHLMESYFHRNGKKPFVRSPLERIPVKFHVDLMHADKILDAMASLTTRAHDLKPDQRSELFELKAVAPRWNEGRVTDANLQAIQAITTTAKTRVEHLELASARFAEAQVSPQVTAEFLRNMLLADDAKYCPTSVKLGSSLSIEVFQAACSALVKAQSVEFLNAKTPERPADDLKFWAWLSYAMFSREADNSIKRLDLDVGKLAHAHVDVLEQVLQAQDPVAFLVVQKTPSDRLDREPVVVDVRTDAKLVVKLETESVEITIVNTTEPTVSLRVVDDSPEQSSVCVVYPGAGVCWVDRDDIVARRTQEIPSKRSAHGIERLGLDLTEDTSLDALLRLVRLVGPGLKTLGIRCLPSYLLLQNATLEALLAACPNVDRLELMHLEVPNFQWLPCKGIRLLSLDSVDAVEPKGYEGLMVDLSSRRVALSELHIQNTEETFEAIEEPIMHLLETNPFLERFFVAGNTDDLDQDVPPRLGDDIRNTTLEPINVQKSPVPLRSKLAFVSGIRPQIATNGRNLRTKRQRSTLPELDAALVELIFQYAAPHKLRVCGAIAFKESW